MECANKGTAESGGERRGKVNAKALSSRSPSASLHIYIRYVTTYTAPSFAAHPLRIAQSPTMSANMLHNSLLRPAILHILRAAGFHSARPSVIDTLADITARYLLLLASRTATNAYSNHNTLEPEITDVRMALQDCGLLTPSLTAAEEAWKEALSKPLEEYPERNGLRAKERMRRDEEDTRDVREFVDWVRGAQNAEIRRIAGLEAQRTTEATDMEGRGDLEDYLTGMYTFLTRQMWVLGKLSHSGRGDRNADKCSAALMKKHSKTGVESRYQGTVLGQPAEARPVRIEGGPVETIQEWVLRTQQRSAKLDALKETKGHAIESIETNGNSTGD